MEQFRILSIFYLLQNVNDNDSVEVLRAQTEDLKPELNKDDSTVATVEE